MGVGSFRPPDESILMSSRRIRNWDRTQSWKPEQIHHPENEEQIAGLIRQAVQDGKRVKPLGSALSWSDIIDVPEIAIRFDRMAEVVEVDRDARRIRLQSGAGLKHVNEVLAMHGLAFDNFGSIVLQTAGGYIGTGTHGTGGKTPILSAAIEKIRLVDGLGEARELDAGREPELFSAARVNLGCLGVVTEITFRCVEAFDLEERLEMVDFDAAMADLGNYVDGNEYCKLWWLPYTDKIQVYTYNRTDRPRGGFGFTGFLDRTGISGGVFTGLMAMSRAFPRLIPFMHDTVQRIHFHPHRRVDRSDRIIKLSNAIPKHQETEYAIPRDRAARAIDETRRLSLEADYGVNFPMEVRFVAADEIPMSPASGRDSCYIGAYVGRPHWGKSFSRTGEQLRALYPAYDDFNRLRRRCDPHGVFRNSFVDRVFPDRRE
jgi:L-gulonolactone oxidase